MSDLAIVIRDRPRLVVSERARDRLVVRDGAAPRLVIRQTGAPGPPGQAGAARDFVFTQSAAAATWTVNHNLGVRPSVTVLTPGGVEVDAAITHLSANQLQIDFAAPQAGVARCL